MLRRIPSAESTWIPPPTSTRVEHDGETFYFYSAHWQASFESDPETYLSPTPTRDTTTIITTAPAPAVSGPMAPRRRGVR